MSLRIKFTLLIACLFAGAALIIWFGVRPGYEEAVTEERIKIVTEYQREKIEKADNLIDLWFTSVLEIEHRMVDSANIQQVQTLFEGFTSMITELQSIRIVEENTGEYVEMRSGSGVSGVSFEELNFQSINFRNRTFFTSFDIENHRFYIVNHFQAFDESFRLMALFDSSILEEFLFSSNLGVGEYEVLWLGNDEVISQSDTIPDFRPDYEPISRIQQIPINGIETFVLSSPLTSMGALFATYLDKTSIQGPIRQLFQNSMWLIGFSFIALSMISLILFRQLTQPVNQFLNDLHSFSEYNFSKPITPISIPELQNVTREMESIRQKLEHYQRINVEKMISSQERIKVILEHASDVIAVFDNTGQFTFRNNRFLKLFETLKCDIPTDFEDFLALGNLSIVREKGVEEYRLQHLNIKKTRTEYRVKSKSRRSYFFDAHMVEITNDNDELMGGQLMMYDLSHEREVDKLRNEMINTIAHELTNPLTGVMLITDLLKSSNVSEEEKQQYYDTIGNSINTMQSLIKRFLMISSLESTNIDHMLELTDLSGSIKEITELLHPQFREKDLTLNLTIEDGLKPALVVPDLFTDLARNLLSNAIKYGPKSRPIDVKLESQKNRLIFSVTDYGFGIKEKDREQIFRKFYRINEYMSEEGTGLGLPYVMEIVKKHKGDIRVESNEDIGSRFIVSIPYHTSVNFEINA